MKLIKANQINKYFLLRFPQEIKNNTLTYFIMGEGYKKTKSYEIVNDSELLELWDKNVNELYIAKIYDKYGIEVAEEYANCKVAGIVARQYAQGYGLIYQRIKDILPNNFSNDFFKLLRCDYMFSCFGIYTLDVVSLDNNLSKYDSEYDSVNCLYKGIQTSMSEYINLKFGIEYNKLIEVLIEEKNFCLV